MASQQASASSIAVMPRDMRRAHGGGTGTKCAASNMIGDTKQHVSRPPEENPGRTVSCKPPASKAASATNGRHVYHTEAQNEHNAHERPPAGPWPLPPLRPPCDGSVVQPDFPVYSAHKIQSPITGTGTIERVECPRCHVTHVVLPSPAGKRLSRIGHHAYTATDAKTTAAGTGRGIRPT